MPWPAGVCAPAGLVAARVHPILAALRKWLITIHPKPLVRYAGQRPRSSKNRVACASSSVPCVPHAQLKHTEATALFGRLIVAITDLSDPGLMAGPDNHSSAVCLGNIKV